MRDISPALDLIKAKENFEPKPYLCPANVWTIGYGTTHYPDGKAVTPNDPPISQEYATECLKFHCKRDCDSIEDFLKKNKIEISDTKFSALISFAYNCGTAPIVKSGKTICEALKVGDHSMVVRGMKLYNKANVNGRMVVLKGLTKRREEEATLYLS